MMAFWTYPTNRYYYPWYDAPPAQPLDSDIKSMVVDRLRENPFTKPFDLKVDVKQGVVVLGGEVSSSVAKRSAGDDAWDTVGVVDVSNQLAIRPLAA
jgi:osmotically-inducible protein OsmY